MASAATFRSIFLWLMGFVALVWICAVVLIFSWPWEKTNKWEPQFRLVATCANNAVCGVAFQDLEASRSKGIIKSLIPPEPVGELQEPEAWLRWKTITGQPWQYEVTSSHWHFETRLRYRIEEDKPVLVEVNQYDIRILNYAIPMALFTILGLFLRTLRK